VTSLGTVDVLPVPVEADLIFRVRYAAKKKDFKFAPLFAIRHNKNQCNTTILFLLLLPLYYHTINYGHKQKDICYGLVMDEISADISLSLARTDRSSQQLTKLV